MRKLGIMFPYTRMALFTGAGPESLLAYLAAGEFKLLASMLEWSGVLTETRSGFSEN